jgi:hypothetical protein
MNNDLKDILSKSNKDIDNQQLMDYLSQQLSQAKGHDIEKSMAEDPFVNDAVEGLQNFKPTKDLQVYVDQLNSDLKKQITKNKKRKEKRRLKDQPYTYFAIILILLLLIICYIVLRKNTRQQQAATQPIIAKQIVLNTTTYQ